MKQSFEKGLVSVIVPAYNAGEFLEQAIATVKAQTYENWEMIIVNDGSTDNTVAVAQNACDDVRIRLYHVPKGKTGSAARARNLGMRNARGEFFAFLDADDKWAPQKLERQVEYLRDHTQAAGVCTWSEPFGCPDRLLRGRRINPTATVVRKKEFYKCISPATTPSLMFQRRCYEEIGGMCEDPRLVTGEDGEFFLRMVLKFEVHRIPEVLTYVRLSPLGNSLSSAHLDTQNKRDWQVLEVMQEKGLFTPQDVRRRTSHLYYQQALDNLLYLKAPFRRYLLRSIVSGYPSVKCLVMFSLSFLPAPLLWRILVRMDRLLGVFLHWRFRKK